MFSGNPALLITDNSLQEYLADKNTGLPLSNGVVTFYRDNSRSVFKNVYYQTGTFGAYTYTALPNPLTLNAAGQVVDDDGNITKIFYYPYDNNSIPNSQPYYITIDDEDAARQYTLENFPFVAPTSGTNNPTFRNLLTNSTFWRNVGSLSSATINATSSPNIIIAPGDHDGWTNGDIRFIKNINTATDTITFSKMPTSVTFANDVAPEYFLNFQCTGATTGETTKCIQIPIQLHLLNLNNQTITITFWAQSVSGSNTLIANIYQFAGSDQAGSSQTLTAQTFSNITTSWVKYSITYTLPSVATIPVSATGDDGYYLQIQLPTNTTTNINLTKPCVYIGTVVPGNEFQTYDQAHAVFDAARTGDHRISLNTFYPFGWVPASNGTIGSSTSNATTRANIDTFQLFNLMWGLFQPYSNGTVNPIAPMYTSAGSLVTYGTTAWQDFIANNQLSLTTQMGEVIIGGVPLTALLAAYKATFTASNSAGNLELTLANVVNFYKGLPITFTTTGTLPTGLTANAVYYVGAYDGATGVVVSTSFANAMAGTYIAYTDAGTGTHTLNSSLSGANTGEYRHIQLSGEVGSHVHGTPGGLFLTSTGSSYTNGTVSPAFGEQADTSANTPSGNPFNIVQPSAYRNIYFKL